MRNQNDPNSSDFADLTRRIDRLLDDTDDIDLSAYTPQDTQVDDTFVYQNYSNSYGNFTPAYAGDSSSQPTQVIPVYNSDFQEGQLHVQQAALNQHNEYRDYGETAAQVQSRKAAKKPKRRRGCCGTIFLCFALVIALVVGAVCFLFQPPRAEHALGSYKRDTATILLCGTDADGTRTDTMMLIYLSGSENRVGLLSLPRDSMTQTSSGKYAKLNSAYGRNGCGEEGMAALMDYVADIIGYEPDGYILVDMTLVPQIVDLMGGVEMDVQQDIEVDGFTVSAGQQRLNGEQVLALLRYRKGYSNADLGRIQVQRSVIQACMKQWISPSRLPLLPQALNLVTERSITNLSTSNFLWAAKTILLGMGDMYNDTLPGYAENRHGASYYILKQGDIADLVNDRYNPFTVTIDADDLNIVG